MELSRQDYPGILPHIQPGQAVKLLNDRVKYINRVNLEIADWMQERRRVEEQYAQGLRKLASKQLSGDIIDLGVFTTPWNKIITSTETLAQSRHALSQNIGQDVEMPLRDFGTSNRELQAMATITGNIQSIGQDVENAHKRADKLKEKGGKASVDRVASAASDVENAQGQWDSQAPYVFERLQAADEARVDHLRNVLTQYQTHIIESVSIVSTSAEDCLNSLLNVQTEDEIKTFAVKTERNIPSTAGTQRRMSRVDPAPSAPDPSPSLPLPRSDDLTSQRSSSIQEKPAKGGFGGGLKRLGTVIGRKRQSMHPYGQSIEESSERKKSTSNIASAFPRFGRKESRQNLERTLSPPSAGHRPSSGSGQSPRASDSAPSPIPEEYSVEGPNEKAPGTNGESSNVAGLANGSTKVTSSLLDPTIQKSVKDAEGFSVPAAHSDPLQQALDEVTITNGSAQPQFKVDIRNVPIQEESGDASAAMAGVASALQAQATPRRTMGTVRGRRDRHTMLMAGSQIPEIPRDPSPATSSTFSVPPASATPPPIVSSLHATQLSQQLPSAQLAQPSLKLSHRNTLGLDDHATSDTHSIRSGRSLSSSTSTTIRHPEMHGPGLNTSIVETLSAWFSHGTVTRAILLGELALAYNPVNLSEPFGSETIRLENFSALEKVAPNPAFIEAVPDQLGQYTVNLSPIVKTSIAFKYQVHLAADSIASHVPLLLKPAWKVEPTRTSVMIHYSMHSAFGKALGEFQSSLTMSNVVIIAHLDPTGAKATSCKAMGGGVFARERNLVYWKLGDINLAKDEPAQVLRARFSTEGEARAGNIEARWEIGDEGMMGLGSGLSVSKLESGGKQSSDEADPFADESTVAQVPSRSWKDIHVVRKGRSGTYVAT